MNLETRHIKLGIDLKQKLDSVLSLSNSEMIRRICRQIRSGKIKPADKKIKMQKPVVTIDAELERWMFDIPQHLIRNALDEVLTKNIEPKLKIEKSDKKYFARGSVNILQSPTF